MDERLDRYIVEPGVLDIRKMQEDGVYPSEQRLRRGPIAVFECAQEIPCNPCESACRQGFIEIGEDITAMPVVDERCTGCGLCLPACPGLSIFVLDATYGEHEATVTLPYELLPLPEVGETVQTLDRRGRAVGTGRVLAVRQRKREDTCWSVTVVIPKTLIHEVRHIEPVPETIVCRCEEVAEREVLEAIRLGARDVDAVKRMTRAGMGLCQGKTCARLVTRLIAAQLGIPPGEVRQATQRLPVRPVAADILSQKAED